MSDEDSSKIYFGNIVVGDQIIFDTDYICTFDVLYVSETSQLFGILYADGDDAYYGPAQLVGTLRTDYDERIRGFCNLETGVLYQGHDIVFVSTDNSDDTVKVLTAVELTIKKAGAA